MSCLRPDAARLRPLRREDVDACALVWRSAWLDGHRDHVPAELLAVRGAEHFEDHLRRHLADATVCVDARAGIVGLVILDRDNGEVVQLAVSAAARGTGVADRLLAWAEAELAALHEHGWLAVVPGNQRARAFYARHGWRDHGARTYRAPADGAAVPVRVRHYVKRLSPAARPRPA